MKSILDKSFRYTPACETDISKTFARALRRIGPQKRIIVKRDGTEVVVSPPPIPFRVPNPS